MNLDDFKKQRACFGDKFTALHNQYSAKAVEPASCKMRLSWAESQLAQLNSQVSNVSGLKAGIAQIMQKLETGDKAGAAQ